MMEREREIRQEREKAGRGEMGQERDRSRARDGGERARDGGREGGGRWGKREREQERVIG